MFNRQIAVRNESMGADLIEDESANNSVCESGPLSDSHVFIQLNVSL